LFPPIGNSSKLEEGTLSTIICSGSSCAFLTGAFLAGAVAFFGGAFVGSGFFSTFSGLSYLLGLTL
jgi:hypothetical protein